MADFLARMAAASRDRVPSLAESRARAADASPVVPLARDRFGVIAEIKACSPSEGRLARVDVPSRAAAYSRGGAAMLSVLTEPTAFGGSLDDLSQAVAAVAIPVMRKDFLVTPAQVAEARAHGASAVLLIARTLGSRLADLLDEAERHDMTALVECFDAADVALTAEHLRPNVLVGVNTRDLSTLEVRADRLAALAPLLPDVPTVAESGILTPEDAAAAQALGYDFVLVGTALMKAEEPEAAVRGLVGRSSPPSASLRSAPPPRRREGEDLDSPPPRGGAVGGRWPVGPEGGPGIGICGLTQEDDVAACVSAREVAAVRALVAARRPDEPRRHGDTEHHGDVEVREAPSSPRDAAPIEALREGGGIPYTSTSPCPPCLRGSPPAPSIKICGLTQEDDVAACVSAGVDMVGFVMAESPRQVTAERARDLARGLPKDVASVLVFHRATSAEVAAACRVARPDVVQTEAVDRFGQAVVVPDEITFLPVVHDGGNPPRQAGLFLLDSAGKGGRGVVCDHGRAAALASHRPLILAGGLRPDTVAAAIARVRPAGVDVSSGVESSPGCKDPALIHAFADAVRSTLSLELSA